MKQYFVTILDHTSGLSYGITVNAGGIDYATSPAYDKIANMLRATGNNDFYLEAIKIELTAPSQH